MNPLSALSQAINAWLNSSTTVSSFNPPKSAATVQPQQSIIGQPPQNQAPQNQTPQNQAPQINPQQLAQQILQGFRAYSGGKAVPMEKYIPQMVQAAMKYPIFQQHPFLIPAVSIVETSAGQNWQQQNNPISWGVRITHEGGGYQPQSAEQAITDMASAVGGDPNRGQGFDPQTAQSRMQTAGYYNKFRQSANLQDFTDQYDGGNPQYLPHLQNALKVFQQPQQPQQAQQPPAQSSQKLGMISASGGSNIASDRYQVATTPSVGMGTGGNPLSNFS